jgi:ribonucrease Y
MTGVLYAAVAAGFLIGIYFVRAYSSRTSSAPRGKHGSGPGGLDLSAGESSELAQQAAKSAQADADAIRRALDGEAEATRRAMRAEAQSATLDAAAIRSRAEAEVAEMLAKAQRTADSEAARLTTELLVQTAELTDRTRRLDDADVRLQAEERRLAAETAELDRGLAILSQRQDALDAAGAAVDAQQAEVTRRTEAFEARQSEFARELERVAGLSAEQAKAELMAGVESAARRDAAVLVRNIEAEARAEGTDRARAIVVEAVQRVASEQTSETVVSVLHLPNDELKGRIIGREGRNIRAYESVTGVNLIIDDTPEAVLLSCFDPIRREVGRLTLERLVQDGRIHPHRIEEAYEQSKAEVDGICLRAARDVLADVGITDLDDRLLPTLGRLKFRTSYGQNVLGHLVETAHIAGVMAAELGIEPTLVKRSAFLHDIGKALTHEVQGSHAIIGAELLRKYGESEQVAHAVEAHHNEVQPKTIEAVLTQASDTCSAARPGARRESLESYVKRLARIEEIAGAKEGVDRVFAMQAGREVRVMVQPSEVDDLAASVIAREIAKQIEDELTYPGQIRVTVVRESRTTEIAH